MSIQFVLSLFFILFLLIKALEPHKKGYQLGLFTILILHYDYV